MVYSIDLAAAAHTLHAHFGRRFTASHLGGRHRLAAILREQFGVAESDALHVIAALARRQAIRSVADPGLARPCSGVLELCGDWLIQPDNVTD
jgi:hypothetical protein